MHTYVPDQQQQSGSTSAVSGFLLASGSHAPVSVLCMNHGMDGIETMWSQTQQFEQLIPNSYGFLILVRNNHLFMLGQHLEN